MGGRKLRCVVIVLVSCFCCVGSTKAQTRAEINQIVDTMVRLCIAGGEKFSATTSGSAGADIKLRSLDVNGNLKGEFNVQKSRVEGLVEGINNALSQVAADEADKVRACLEPVRTRLLEIMLPLPPGQRTVAPTPTESAFVWLKVKGIILNHMQPGHYIGQVTANVNGAFFRYPSAAGVQWLEIKQPMVAEQFSVIKRDSYTITFTASIRNLSGGQDQFLASQNSIVLDNISLPVDRTYEIYPVTRTVTRGASPGTVTHAAAPVGLILFELSQKPSS